MTRALARVVAFFTKLPTVDMFRRDALLAVLTLACAGLALAPLFFTPILPLVDLGSHVGATGLLNDVALGRGNAGQYFEINTRITPYWTVYLFMSAVDLVAGPFVAAKVTVGIAVVLLPLGVMRLLVGFGRNPRLGLLAFLLSWDTNLYWGFLTFQFGMAMSLFAIAWLFEARRFRDALWILPACVVIALTHVHAVALLGVTGVLLCLVKRPFFRTVAMHAVALSGCLAGLLPWVFKRVEGAPSKGALRFDWHTPGQKIEKLYGFTLDNLPNAQTRTGLAFALLWVAPAMFYVMRARDPGRERRHAPLMFLLAALLLYFCLPWAIWGPIEHWWTYPRFGTYILLGLLAVPCADLTGKRVLALLPGLVALVFVHTGVAKQFKEYGAYVRPYLQIISKLPRGVAFFPLDMEVRHFKGTKEGALGQLHGYAAAATSSFDPHLFDQADTPLLFKKPRKLPQINWFKPASFNMKDHGKFYDYIIVHPLDKDVIASNAQWKSEVELIVEAGQWRLYRVKEKTPARR